MSPEEVRLASYMVKEHFGDVVQEIAKCLLEKGRQHIRNLISLTKLQRAQVQSSLFVLIQHNLASFEEDVTDGTTYYEIDLKACLLRTRFPRFIQLAKVLYGVEGELLTTQLLQDGRLAYEELMNKVKQIDTTIPESRFVDKFIAFVEHHFFMRIKNPLQNDEGEDAFDPYELPAELQTLNLGKRKRADDGPERARKKGPGAGGLADTSADAKVYWRVNFDQLHLHMRNKAIEALVRETVDASAAALVGQMLQLDELAAKAPTTIPVSVYALTEALTKAGTKLTPSEADQYLQVMSHSSTKIVSACEATAAPRYSINVERAVRFLQQRAIESVIQERFGAVSCRMFRLILSKKMIEQKQISDLAMVAAKECKDRLYEMVAAGMLHVQEVSRTADHKPQATVYLYTVRLPQLVTVVLEELTKTHANVKALKAHELQQHDRLLQKVHRIEEQTLAGAEAVKEELSDVERTTYLKLTAALNKLEAGELLLDESIATMRDLY
eukprot:Colp12_sorted_trinity150504_noHs@967